MFWTDVNQAQERLTNTAVNYDGKPAIIEEVYTDRNGEPKATALLASTKNRVRLSLSDEKWNNFRDLPRLGWFNYVSAERGSINPMFIERRAVNARTHGLTTNNTNTYSTNALGLEKDRYNHLFEYLRNDGYLETADSEESFPKLSAVLMSLDESPGGVAFSRKFCVIVTEEGVKWLFRKTNRIGFFTGTDSLNLFPKNGFYKEELQACPNFDIANVKEF